jgi:hypothetical protein
LSNGLIREKYRAKYSPDLKGLYECISERLNRQTVRNRFDSRNDHIAFRLGISVEELAPLKKELHQGGLISVKRKSGGAVYSFTEKADWTPRPQPPQPPQPKKTLATLLPPLPTTTPSGQKFFIVRNQDERTATANRN